MATQISWEEVTRIYPDEWVAFANYQLTGPIEVKGEIIAHHSQKQQFYQQLQHIREHYPNIAVRFTGVLVKNPEIPP